jgi:RNA polymerase sigma factor (sigma-70 family)
LGSSFLVTVPFRAVDSRCGRVRSAGGRSVEAWANPPDTRVGSTGGLPHHAAEAVHATTTSIVVMRGFATGTETVLDTADAPPAAASCPRDDVDLELLRAVQAYLGRLSHHPASDAADRGCWERFYRRYDHFIRRVVRAWHLSDADTEDCIQEVWAELITKLAGVDYDPRRGRLRSWLFTFVRRKVIRFLRRKSRHSTQSLTNPAATLVSLDCDPSTACERQEDRQLVRRMLAVLRTQVSDTNYQVLHLRWIDGRSSAEIAAMVNLTRDQVHYRLGRMKRKLRTLIAPHIAGNDPFRLP